MAFSLKKILKGILIRQEGTQTPKEIEIIPGGSASTKTTITSSQTTNKTITIPDATDTLVGKATTDVLTNKSIDADTNTITNIENADIKAAAAIDATKIANGSVTNAEFQQLDGITSPVVGTTQSQTLTTKTIVVANNTITTAAAGNLAATELNAALTELQSDIDTRATSTALTTHTGLSSGVHGVAGSVVGTTDTQTLTNKSLSQPNITDLEIYTQQASVGTTPAAGKRYLYAKSDGFYEKTDAGVENRIGVGSGSTPTVDLFSGNGVQTAFTLSINPGAKDNTMVFVTGAYQNKDTYSLSGTTLTFSEAPPNLASVQVITGGTYNVGVPPDDSISTAKIQNNAVTKAKLSASNHQISASSGNYSSASTSPVDVTNLSVTITSSGRPIQLMLVSDGTAGSLSTQSTDASGLTDTKINLVRDSTTISFVELGSKGPASSPFIKIPPSSVNYLDIVVAGTYTYKVQIQNVTWAGNTTFVRFSKLVAYEI